VRRLERSHWHTRCLVIIRRTRNAGVRKESVLRERTKSSICKGARTRPNQAKLPTLSELGRLVRSAALGRTRLALQRCAAARGEHAGRSREEEQA